MAKTLFELLQEEGRSVFPAPQRFFDPADKAYNPKLGGMFEYTPGGRYLEMGPEGPKDITGQRPKQAVIGVTGDGKPIMKVSQELDTTGEVKKTGRKVKTNLFKKKAGWNWTEVPEGFNPNPDKNFPLVSVEDGKKHYYTVQAEFPEGVDLERYEKSTTEPRLRPTKKGELELGDKIGEIEVRGKTHPVYKAIKIFGPIGAAIGVGLSTLGLAEDAMADGIDLNAAPGDLWNMLSPLGFDIPEVGEGSDVVPLDKPMFIDQYVTEDDLLGGSF
jgi:hypothetical protein